MLHVQLLYFAGLRDLAGVSEERVELPDETNTVARVARFACEKHPALRLDGVRIAVNEEFADEHASVSDGDVVAFIPPVSGG